MKVNYRYYRLALSFLAIFAALTMAQAQITPSGDSYTNTATPTTNFGAKTVLDVESASQNSYIEFDLSSIPAGYTASDITKATLKLYVNTVTKAGSFNVDYVNGTWAEATIDANNAPALGSTIAASVPLTTADKNQYILIDITSAVQAWLNGTANDGIALVGNSPLNASFDSKESTSTSHAAELDIVFASGNGTIAGVNTASGSGLTGGGDSGTLNLSLLTSCSSGQVLSWSGAAWVCTTATGTGTVTSVASGLGLSGGPITTSGTLSIDTTAVPLLSSYNTFTFGQAITTNGNVDGLDSFASAPGFNGLLGISTATSGSSAGVVGASESLSGYGVYGSNSGSSGIGVYGIGQTGVEAVSAVCCEGAGGVFTGYAAPSGSAMNGTNGIVATGGSGDPSISSGSGNGIVGTGGSSPGEGGLGGWFVGGNASAPDTYGGAGVLVEGGTGSLGDEYAGFFIGNVNVTGELYASVKAFKIDHPVDPANKYLVHVSVESSELMNIYTGNVITDATGNAKVQLPEWFEALNTDFRYQLTVIGQFAQAIVASEIQNHQFGIKTNVPNVKVSWQVTGVRPDACAKSHPLVVEPVKDAREKGFYLNPELYGAPKEQQVQWARYPETMKRAENQRHAPRSAVPSVVLPTNSAPALPLAMQRALKSNK